MNDPDAYREQVETSFQVENTPGPIALRLVRVTDVQVSGGMEQFSLFFHGPGDQVLPQGTYALQHDVMGSLALFIVPVVGSNPERTVYEACFSGPAPVRSART